MTTPSVEEFARRVERLCDFFIAKITEETGRTGTNDLKVLEDLKEDAATLQFNTPGVATAIEGLDSYMRSLPNEPDPGSGRKEDRS